ncbi:MAG: phosphate ABC transporter, permease protein PstA [Xanthomonadaceae bacterium]|nr:phosphate ABC transporter, permease protein PstA [Xanthomonadaceae bacterium]
MDTTFAERLFLRRRIVNGLALVLSGAAAIVGLFFLGWILFTTLSKGIDGLSVAMFTEMTPPPGADLGVGGLLNAILGSIIMCTLAVLMAAPIGIAAGTYLAEYANYRKIGTVIRFVNDILLSAPSIVLGLFVYVVLIGAPMQVSEILRDTEAGQTGWLVGVADWLQGIAGFSAIAGAVALGFIVLPVVVRTTDEMLQLVPTQMREAALSLGIPQWKVTTHVLYRAALSGILTGVMLGLARISGETAPLLFTAFNNSFFNLDLGEPMANLPVTIYQFAMSPFENWQLLAWAGAFLITCFVLLVSITARFLLLRKKIAND